MIDPKIHQEMIEKSEEFFGTQSDPNQMRISKESADKLYEIYPKAIHYKVINDHPVAWIVTLPTTQKLMKKFIGGEITEQGLLDQTQPGELYDAVYLCSAIVVPEYRGKGFAKELFMEVLADIRNKYPIKYLFAWSFNSQGNRLAKFIAKASGLPLLDKNNTFNE